GGGEVVRAWWPGGPESARVGGHCDELLAIATSRRSRACGTRERRAADRAWWQLRRHVRCDRRRDDDRPRRSRRAVARCARRLQHAGDNRERLSRRDGARCAHRTLLALVGDEHTWLRRDGGRERRPWWRARSRSGGADAARGVGGEGSARV